MRFFILQRREVMRFVVTLLFALSSVLAHAGNGSASGRLTDEQIVADLRTYLQQQAAQGAFSGAVLLAKGDTVLFKGAYGLANRAFNAPNRVDTRFNLGSMGKMFTGVAIMQLVQQGKLQLDDKLGNAVPDYPDKDIAAKVTIRQLLNHTSGLGDMFGKKFEDTSKHRLNTVEGHLPLFVGAPLQFEPGTKFAYSNAGFIALGLVIERLSGQTYYDYVREHIFKPAGMLDTDNYRPDEDIPNLAVGYTRGMGPGMAPLPETGGQAATLVTNRDFLHRGASAGGGYSTVEDLLRFSRALQGYKLLNQANAQLMMTGTVHMDRGGGEYGLAMIDSKVNAVRIVGHSGGAPGINSKLDMYPDLGYVVAVMTNIDAGTRGVISRLQYVLTGQALPQAIKLPAKALRAYAGKYEPVPPDAAARRLPAIQIAVDDEALLVNTGFGPARKFLPMSAERFFDEASINVQLTFARDRRGQIESVTIDGVGPFPVKAKRVS